MNDIIENGSTQVVAQAPANASVAAPSNPTGLLQMAIQQGASLEQLEKLMAMQERYDAAQAKKAYDQAFAAFKAEAIVILKGKKVDNGPLSGKKYAELHTVVAAVTPALSRHGLSSSWKLTKDDKDWMEVTCVLRHVDGHQESVSMGGPPDTGGAKNALQARASTKTYLERYTLKAITGTSEQGDDSDGAGSQDEKKPAVKAKAKTPITGVRFANALETIRNGQYHAAKLRANWALTTDQETQLSDLEKELA
ncbi:MAG: hypothetical protein JWP38_3692 [Herbaspirillum sp.]|nr:hypothetical protein [Herbaspirillum sp.]